jgi:hypothetical protein
MQLRQGLQGGLQGGFFFQNRYAFLEGCSEGGFQNRYAFLKGCSEGGGGQNRYAFLEGGSEGFFRIATNFRRVAVRVDCFYVSMLVYYKDAAPVQQMQQSGAFPSSR